MDKQIRTIYKSITWRIAAVVTTVLTIYVWTGDWRISLGSGIAANIIKAAFYYFHERVWNSVKWGTV
ncbi:DUF2061 domain-containing protein [Candidatus Woesearchaeota archaeon]|nr:DUF2061 domain-containing protein [Candidatus Woesearchaeota archaeon]